MKNKLSKFTTTSFCLLFFGFYGYSQDNNMPKKLEYTVHVDNLLNQDQVTRLDNTLKRKIGIISDDINFETKTIIITTTEEVTYPLVLDVLSTEGLKAQTYSLKIE